MTESEAKEKWCPMVVFMLGGGQVRNRDACYDNSGTHCIGSKCMMWREIIGPETSYPTYKVTLTKNGEMKSQKVDIYDYGGCCGLAGKP